MTNGEQLFKQEGPINLGIGPSNKQSQPNRQPLQENGLHMSTTEPVVDRERATELVLSVSMADPALTSSAGGTPRGEFSFSSTKNPLK